MSKLPIYKEKSFDQKREEFERGRLLWKEYYPLKGLKSLPKMVGISEETKKFLKFKAFKWILTQDHTGGVRREILKKPFTFGFRYLKSLFKRKSYVREGDFFLYGHSSLKNFKEDLSKEKGLFVVGFSYCQKPLECPSKRFTPDCIHEENHPVCSQCPIGKMHHLLPADTHFLIIPTVHYIGEEVLKLANQNRDKKIRFMITACEMTLEMFGDFGNMAGIDGIGVRLDGRICNTMEAFALSERGVKPGLTVVLEQTEEKMLEVVRQLYL